MEPVNLSDAKFTNVEHLPIVKEYARKIKLTETVDQMVESQMELSPGVAVLAMVLDTLTGRSPLYRLVDVYRKKDGELLLGQSVEQNFFQIIILAVYWIRSTNPGPKRFLDNWPKMPSVVFKLTRNAVTTTPHR